MPGKLLNFYHFSVENVNPLDYFAAFCFPLKSISNTCSDTSLRLTVCFVSLETVSGIGLGPRDVRFCTLQYKIAHNFNGECAIFASKIMYLVNRWNARTELVKIAYKKVQKCVILHIIIFSDIRLPLKKSLFPVQRVAEIMASRAAAKSSSLFFFRFFG